MSDRPRRRGVPASSAPVPRRSTRIISQGSSLPPTPMRAARSRRQYSRSSSVDDPEVRSSPRVVVEMPPTIYKLPSEDESVDNHENGRLGTPSQASSVSGLTGHIVDNLRNKANDLRRTLPDLYKCSIRVLDILKAALMSPSDVNDFASNINTDQTMSIHNFTKAFEEFTGDNSWCIRTDAVERALLDIDDDIPLEKGLWSPAEMLHISNLTKMMVDVVTLHPGTEENLARLNRLDNLFPQELMSKHAATNLTPEDNKLLEETFNVELAIRTQVTIASMSQGVIQYDNAFDPDTTLKQTFCTVDGSRVSPKLLKNWPAAEEFLRQSSAARRKFEVKVQGRMFEFRAYFREDAEELSHGDIVDLDGLQKQFPWFEFVQDFSTWIFTRQAELEKELARKGGMEALTSALTEKMGEIDVQRYQLPAAERQATLLAMKKFVRKGKLWPEASSSTAQLLPATALQPVQNANDPASNVLSTVEEEDSSEPEVAQPRRDRGRSYMDRQPNAIRVAEIGEDDESQPYDRFQTDTRTINITERRAQAEAISKRAPPRRSEQVPPSPIQTTENLVSASSPAPSVRPGSTAETIHAIPSTRSPQSAKKATKRPLPQGADGGDGAEDGDYVDVDVSDRNAQSNTSDAPEGTPFPNNIPPSSNYQQTEKRARKMTSVGNHGVRQIRYEWSIIETDALIEYIRKYGISWTKIASHDASNILARRDQYALKDKARNMKFNYLKIGQDLPKNFEYITLTPTHRKKLEELGINHGWVRQRRLPNQLSSDSD